MPSLTEKELQRLLMSWDGTGQKYPDNKGIHELFESQVEHTPDRIAVIFDEQRLTYQELNQRANQLAELLHSKDIGRGDFVPVLMERCVELIISYLAIMKVGAAFSPLDPKWPVERIDEILTQLNGQAVLVTEEISCLSDLTRWPLLPIHENLLAGSKPNLGIPVSVEDPIYVMFTSGSTGTPKGAINQHLGIHNRFFNMDEWCGCREEDVILLISNHVYDGSVWQLFWPLLNGARLVIPPPTQGFDLQLIIKLIDQEKVSITDFVPSVFTLLVDHITHHAEVRLRLHSLRHLFIGGETMKAGPISRFMEFFPQVGITNDYGPTETSIGVIFYEVPADCSDPIPIGKPISNVYALLLDENHNMVPFGQVGELYLGGACVGLGYLNNITATESVFIPNPFKELPCTTLYKTGDKARYLTDGNLQFLGRIDDQVKIHGIRIEPGEIEVALNGHPGVKECVVIGREDEIGHQYLAAYLVSPTNTAPAIDDLRQFLRQKLPTSMVPSAFEFLDALPLSPVGKVNRHALPIPERVPPKVNKAVARPMSPIEQTLESVWGELLGRDFIAPHDNFFELGGNSLLIIWLQFRIKDIFRVEISPRRLFDIPTIADLAKEIDSCQRNVLVPEGAPITRQPRQEPLVFPMSDYQLRMWFLDQRSPLCPAYNYVESRRITGPLDIQVLEACVIDVIHRHEILRTTFGIKGGQPVQMVLSSLKFSIPVLDLRQTPANQRDLEARRIGEEEFLRPFNLAQAPLLRVTLLQLGKEEYVFLLVMHQIVTDWWSTGNFFKEINSLYDAYASHEHSSLPTLPVQVGDVTVWEQQREQHETYYRCITYWKNQLSKPLPVLDLPCDFPRPKVQTYVGGQCFFELSDQVTKSLKSLCRQAGVTVYMYLLANYFVLLQKASGQTDIIIGSSLAIRERPEIVPLIGFFINGIVLRPDLSGDPTFREFLHRVRQVALDGFTYKDLPFQKLVEAVLPKRDLRHSMILQANFVLQNAPTEELNIPGLSIQPFLIEHKISQLDLELEMEERGGKLLGKFTYNSDLFHRQTVEHWAGQFVCLFEKGLDNPDLRLSELPFDSGMDEMVDSYPLSPMQQAMLVQNLHRSELGVDVEQLVLHLSEPLHIDALRSAWRQTMERHPVLRTCFHWESEGDPQQNVYRSPLLPWEELDWRWLDRHMQQKKLEDFLNADRKRNFNLAKPPLFRVTLIRIDENEYDLIWTFHHIILDGPSVPSLLDEIFALHRASREGQGLDLPALPPYRRFIDWLSKQDLLKAESFWKECLKGLTTPTFLAMAKEGEDTRSDTLQYGEQKTQLSAQFSSHLAQLRHDRNLTLNTVAQGAWAFVLHKYTGRNDVVFGAVKSGRRAPIEGIHSMVGLFINTLPIRVQLQQDMCVGAWLKDLRKERQERRQYEHTPLYKIQSWSEVPNGVPMFDSLLIVDPMYWKTVLRGKGKEWETREFRHLDKPPTPLTLHIYAEDVVHIVVTYDRKRFEEAAISRLLTHLTRIMEEMVSNPAQRIGDLSLLSPEERLQIVNQFNPKPKNTLKKQCIHTLFEEQVKRTPHAVAVTCGTERLTYQELNCRANQLAHWLHRLQVEPEDLVGIYMERSLEMVIGLLGVLKSGGAYVPLDTTYPPQRLAFMAETARIKVLLTQKRLPAFPPLPKDIQIVFIDKDSEKIAQMPVANLLKDGQPSNLAYGIFTSGSTGRPKGILIQHQSLVNHSVATAQHYDLQSTDRVLQFSSLSFDVAAEELYPTLISGGTVVLRGESTIPVPEEFGAFIRQEKLTVVNLPASYWGEWVHHVYLGQERLPDSLRLVIVGSEKVPANTLAKWKSCVGNRIGWSNAYGPSETTITTTIYEPKSANGHPGDLPVPIGHPIVNTRVYVLDSELHPLPIGIPGDLYIGGIGLARGYMNQPELTADRFLPDPLSLKSGSRLYKTGDRACWLSDGILQFLGRNDMQIKLRGFRIELGEIEAVLTQHPEIREAVVQIHGTAEKKRQLVAYVVPARTGVCTPWELRTFLRKHVPEYMVPAAFVVLDVLPLTGNGKVDRGALPAPDGGRSGLDTRFVTPRTPIEEDVAKIWREVLSLDQVGVYDNFFELGGHSLLATQVVSRIHHTFKIEFPLRTLFDTPSIAGLADAIEALCQSVPGSQTTSSWKKENRVEVEF